MAGNYVLPVRRAILPRMKGDGPLIALIPAASIYPGTVPATRTFPFTRFGTIIATPFRASGLDSVQGRASIQAFTKDLKNDGGTVIASAEDQIFRIGSAIKDSLDDAVLTLEGGMKLRLAWIQSSPVQDPSEASAWMTTETFRIEVAG